MRVIDWTKLQITEQDLVQALRDANDEQDFLKQIVIKLLRQRDSWENRRDCVELFHPARRYEHGQIIAVPCREQGWDFDLWKCVRVVSTSEDENPVQGQFQIVQLEGLQQKLAAGIPGAPDLPFQFPSEASLERASECILRLHKAVFEQKFPFATERGRTVLRDIFQGKEVWDISSIMQRLKDEGLLGDWSEDTLRLLTEWLLRKNGYLPFGENRWTSSKPNRPVKRSPDVPRIRDAWGEHDLRKIEEEAEDEIEAPIHDDFGEEATEQPSDPMLTMSLQDWRNLPPPIGPIKLPTLTYQHIIEAYFPLTEELSQFFPPGETVGVEIIFVEKPFRFWVNRKDKTLQAFDEDAMQFTEALRAYGIPAGTYVWLERIDEFHYRLFARALLQPRLVRAKRIWLDNQKRLHCEEIDFQMRYEGNPYLVVSELRLEDLEALWREAQLSGISILTAMCRAFQEIDPESKGVHQTELFNAVFFRYRSCSPKTVLALLYRYQCFEPLGNGKWRYVPHKGLSRKPKSYKPMLRIKYLPSSLVLGQKCNFTVCAQRVRKIEVSVRIEEIFAEPIQVGNWILSQDKADIPCSVQFEREGLWTVHAVGVAIDGRKLEDRKSVEVILPLPKPIRWSVDKIERDLRFRSVVERWLKNWHPSLNLDAIKQHYREQHMGG